MRGINRDNPTPLYEQLKLIIRDQIMLGDLTPGSLLPSEQTYCEKYQISRITVSRALNDLEREGFISRVQGKGSMVIFPHFNENLKSIKGFSRTIREAGKRVYSKILSIERFIGQSSLAEIFNLPLDQEHSFIRFRRLRFVNDVPVVIMTSIVREVLGVKLQQYDLETASFYDLYEQIFGVPVVRNETRLTPICATQEIVELLNVKPGSPHFLFRGTSYIQGEIPVELCIAIFHGNYFQFSTNIYRLNEGEISDLKAETIANVTLAP